MKKELISDGGETRIYATDSPERIIVHFKDTATAFGGIKKASVKDKGKYCNGISSIIFRKLEKEGIPVHFISVVDDREQLCRKTSTIPLLIIVRNKLAGSTAEMLGVANGTAIPNVVYELRLADASLSTPMINRHHAVAMGIVTYKEAEEIMDLAERTNTVLKELFADCGIELIDFKMECGRTPEGGIAINGGISPDNARLWDMESGKVLDKDRFRHDMSDVAASYREVMERLEKAE